MCQFVPGHVQGIVLWPEIRALAMIASSIIVALNATLLKRARLSIIGGGS